MHFWPGESVHEAVWGRRKDASSGELLVTNDPMEITPAYVRVDVAVIGIALVVSRIRDASFRGAPRTGDRAESVTELPGSVRIKIGLAVGSCKILPSLGMTHGQCALVYGFTVKIAGCSRLMKSQ